MLSKIIFFAILFTFTACNAQFEIGTCLQKADSSEIWKVTQQTPQALIEGQTGNSLGTTKELSGNDWIKTSCPTPTTI